MGRQTSVNWEKITAMKQTDKTIYLKYMLLITMPNIKVRRKDQIQKQEELPKSED